jgi:hypothetical protein
MSTSDEVLRMNVPAKVKRWLDEETGGVTVELLSKFGDLDIGTVLDVTVRRRETDRNLAADFQFHRKKNNLRLGGVVFLRRLQIEAEGKATVIEAEVLLEREDDGPPFIFQNAHVYLYPPSMEKSMYVSELLVAMTSETISFTKKDDALTRLPTALQQAAAFGIPGVMLVGLATDGKEFWSVEDTIGGDEAFPIEAFLRAAAMKIDEEALPAIRKTKEAWHLVPFFKALVDEDMNRRGKISAQRDKLKAKYEVDVGGGAIQKRWTPSNVVMRPNLETWLVCEAAFIDETADNEPKEMYDILMDDGQ